MKWACMLPVCGAVDDVQAKLRMVEYRYANCADSRRQEGGVDGDGTKDAGVSDGLGRR